MYSSTLERWAMSVAGVGVGLAFLVPNHYEPWLSFYQEVVAVIAWVPLAFWILMRNIAPPKMASIVITCALIPVLQYSSGSIPFLGDALLSALYILGLGLAMYVGYAYSCLQQSAGVDAHQKLMPIWLGIVIAGIVSVGIAIHQWLSLGEFVIWIAEVPPATRPGANLSQANHFATLLLLSLLGLCFLWHANLIGKLAAIVAVPWFVFGLVMSGSRSVMLAGALIFCAFALMKERSRLRLSWSILWGCVLLFLAFSYFWPFLNQTLLLTNEAGSAVARGADVGIRKVYWLSTLDAAWQSPWFGYGWQQIPVAQWMTVLQHDNTHTNFDSSHNIVLDLIIWCGIPFTLFLVCAFAWWCTLQVLRCRDFSVWTALMAVCVLLNHAMLEYPLKYAYFLLPFGFWLGVLSANQFVNVSLRKSIVPFFLKVWLIRGAAVAAGALFLQVVMEYMPYEQSWRESRFKEAKISVNENIQLPDKVILDNLHEMMSVFQFQPAADMAEADISRLRKVVQRYPYAASMYKYARVQAMNHDQQGAMLTLKRLCSMHSISACEAAKKSAMDSAEFDFLQAGNFNF